MRYTTLGFVLLAGCAPAPAPRKAAPPDPVRITMFYAVPPKVPRGETAQLCYGVENAVAVALQPPVEEIKPSINRCFEIHPAQRTEFELTATGADGRTDKQRVTVDLVGPRVRIIEVQVSALEVNPGEAVSICWKTENARSVEIWPAGLKRSEANCVTDQPRETRVYKVIARGDGGAEDTEKVEVRVRKR